VSKNKNVEVDFEENLDGVSPDDFVSAENLEEDKNEITKIDIADPEWSKYVMTKFAENELDDKGNPKVVGLRRVARLLLGPILASKARVVQSPSVFGDQGLMQPAVVEHTVKILFGDHEVEFTEAADCYYGNTDPEFARYLTATASTRAEGRALRKALQLNAIASEEATKTEFDAIDIMTEGNITDTQINFIDILCRRNNVNLWKYINAGKVKYKEIGEVSFATAQKMAECLSVWQSDPSKIQSNLVGYDPNWRNV
jgi:hypothetical protein